MKALIITADGPEHRFVTKHLVESIGEHLCGVVVEHGKQRTSFMTSLKKASRKYRPLTVIERLITKLVRKLLKTSKKQANALSEAFGEINPKLYLSPETPVLQVESANHQDCIEWIRNKNPDYIFVYGTGIIGKNVLALPKEQTLNLHTGISPFYRGSACAFWPLFNKEPHMVGSTVHKCTPEVDGGEIYGRITARLSENDTPYSAFANAVKAGSSLYAKIAGRLVKGENVQSEKQDFSLGKEYTFKDKTFIQEIIMEYRVSSGKLKKTIASTENTSPPYTENKER